MSGLNCAPYRDDLLWYVAGQLTPSQRFTLEQHLLTCPACRSELQRWQSIAEAFHQRSQLVPVDTHAASTLAQLRIHIQHPSAVSTLPMSGESDMLFENTSLPPSSPKPASQKRAPRWLAPVASIMLVIVGITLFTVLHAVLEKHNPAIKPSGVPLTYTPATPGPQLVLNPNWRIMSTSVLSGNDIWAVGTASATSASHQALMLHFTGKQWQVISSPDFDNAELSAISMITPNEGWATGDIPPVSTQAGYPDTPFLLHYTHGAWLKVTGPMNGGLLSDIQMYSATEGIASGRDGDGQEVLLHYSDGQWSSDIALPPSFPASTGSQIGTAFFQTVGPNALWAWDNQTIWQRQNGQWINRSPTTFQTHQEQVVGVWVAKTNNIWATVATSQGTSSTTLVHFDGANWTSSTLPQGTLLPQETLGGFFFSPGWLKVVSPAQSNPTFVVLHRENGVWRRSSLPVGYLYSIHDVSPLESWTVGVGGTTTRATFDIYHYLNGTWTAISS